MSDASPPTEPRVLPVPHQGDGMRLDRFLSARFHDRSRSEFTKAIRAGQVCDASDAPLRGSHRVRTGDVLHLFVPGIAPSGDAPPMPQVLHEDDRVIVVNKPAGLLAHPAGTAFAYSVIGLAKAHWPDDHIDLVHRLDRDTSGTLVLTKDQDANRFFKAAMVDGRAHKVYTALCKGEVPWTHQSLCAPIGLARGVIRIQMGVCEDGQPARTDAACEGSRSLADGRQISRVRCTLFTGRTHQIRVHLAHAGHPVLGDRLYGVPPAVFLVGLRDGLTPWVHGQAGAPRHALHATELRLPHPDGGSIEVSAPLPDDMNSWWQTPEAAGWRPFEPAPEDAPTA